MKKQKNTEVRIKKYAILLLLALAVSNISSSGGSLSLEDIQLCSLLVFDCDESGCNIAFVTSSPELGDSSKGRYSCVVGSGERIGECIIDAQSQLEKTIYFGQVESIFLSERLTRDRQRMEEVFDYIERNPFINYAVSLYVLGSSCKQLDSLIGDQDEQAAEFLDNLLLKEPSETFLSRNLYRVARLGGTFALPYIALDDSLRFNGFVTCREFLLWGKFSKEEEIIYLFLNGEANEEYTKTESGEFVVKRVKSNIRLRDGVLHFELNAKCAVITLKNYDTIDTEEQLRLEKMLSEKLQSDCRKLVERVVALDCDVLGVGDYLYRFHPEESKSLKQAGRSPLSAYPISVGVETTIVNNGIMY